MRVERGLIRKEERFWWMNILFPLFLGMILYSILNMPFLLTSLVNRLYGPGRITMNGREMISEKTFLGILSYGRDFLWAFSLIFAVSRLYRDSFSGLKKAFTVAMIFEIFIGIWKIVRIPGNTFEPTAVSAVILADVLAVLFILLHKRALI